MSLKRIEGLPEGTEIRNVANIVFDYQESIATNQVDPHDSSQGTDTDKEALVTIAPATVNLTTSSTSGGSITIPGESVYTQNWGEEVALTAAPDTDSVFVNWTGDVSTVSDVNAAQTTMTMYGDFTVTANFATEEQHPVAEAGPGQNALTGNPLILDGSDSFDPQGDMITYEWAFVNIPDGSTVDNISLSDATSAQPDFIPDVDGDYFLELTVNDGVLQSADTITIYASQPNVAPNAYAGADQNALTGSMVYLDGSSSNDPDIGPLDLSFNWRFDALPLLSILTDNDIIDSDKVMASFTPDVDGFYEIGLDVSDGELLDNDALSIESYSSDVPPNADAGDDILIPFGQSAVCDGSESNDPDASPAPPGFAWSLIAVPSGSTISNNDLQNTSTEYPSFTPDVTGTYVLELMCNDGQNTSFDNMAITVCSIDDNDCDGVPESIFHFFKYRIS